MAELNTKTPASGKKVRSRKMAPKVDLTAMVDLAFLLITFFMLTTSLSKPHQLDVAMPDNTLQTSVDMDEKRVVTLVLGEGKISWYHGGFQNPITPPISIDLKTKELRQLLIKLNQDIPAISNGKDMMVLIKPSKEARTKDIVQTLDEMKITNIKRYMISKVSAQEEELVLASK